MCHLKKEKEKRAKITEEKHALKAKRKSPPKGKPFQHWACLSRIQLGSPWLCLYSFSVWLLIPYLVFVDFRTCLVENSPGYRHKTALVRSESGRNQVKIRSESGPGGVVQRGPWGGSDWGVLCPQAKKEGIINLTQKRLKRDVFPLF